MPRKSIGEFAKGLGYPLYPYQEEIAEAILDSVYNKRGTTISVLLARQMGKNEISAIVEAYLLMNKDNGTIIKAAPTYKPQVINSRQRLLKILEHPCIRKGVWQAHGYIVGVAPSPELCEVQAGARTLFFSADIGARVVGATASILLEIDEAQDVRIEKYNTDFRPMAATTNATTVLYGTAWTDNSLLAVVQAKNLELEKQDGIRRHFQYDWRTLAAINPNYKAYVEGEIARLGEEHRTIRTQYRLLPMEGGGYLFSELQHHLLSGQHQWEEEPKEEEDEDAEDYYVAGIDVGGEERATIGVGLGRMQGMVATEKRDATVVTIGRVSRNEQDLAKIAVVHQYWFKGVVYAEQYMMLSEIIERWNIRRVVIDATGLGEGLASLLVDRFTDDKVTAFKFTRATKSKLTYELLGMINRGRLSLYARNGAPEAIYKECWKQIRLARYRMPGEGLLAMYVPAGEGHDDFLMSLALCCEAAGKPAPTFFGSIMIPPREPWYMRGGGWY